jgi:hypothetical protein
VILALDGLQVLGLKLYDRVTRVSDCIAHVQEKRLPSAFKQLLTKGMKATAMLWSPLQSAYKPVHQVASIISESRATHRDAGSRALPGVREPDAQCFRARAVRAERYPYRGDLPESSMLAFSMMDTG